VATNDMRFFDVVSARRSVRQFTGEAVPLEVLESIVQAGLEAPTGCNAQLRQYVIVTDPVVMDQLRPISKAIDGAAAAIVQLIEPKGTQWGDDHIQDAAASIENMLLASVALGYASCWIEGQVRRSHDQIRRILGVPATLDVSAILPIGRAGQQPRRPDKATLAQAAHYNAYGKRKA
jgi:nitroreductase